QRRVALRGDSRRVEDVVVGEQRDESTENRRRRLRGELLADDRADERAQMILALPIRHPAGADSFDRGAEDRIMSHQISARARVSFGRERSWRRGGGRGLNAQAGLGAEARTFFWRAKAGLPAEARARVVRAKVGH